MTYIFYSDPGHGWLRVRRSELQELGIADKITEYSYVFGDYVYLEEDDDYHTFKKAYKGKHGRDPETRDVIEDTTSKIRTFERYKDGTYANSHVIVADEGDNGQVNFWSNEDGWSDYLESATRCDDDLKSMISSSGWMPVGKNVRWARVGDIMKAGYSVNE